MDLLMRLPLHLQSSQRGQFHDSQLAAQASSVSSKLTAAKPVTWRGRGDLPQFSWVNPPLRGKWLVLDLWSGMGGLCLALVTMGTHFYALAAECDEACRDCVRQTMPNVVHAPRVEDIQVCDLKAIAKRRNLRGILLGGGSPCQGNSVLNAGRLGLADDRSLQPQALQRLAQDIRSDPDFQDLEVITFLENVDSMPAEVRNAYSSWMGSNPVQVNAATCGWVQRRRLYWLTGRSRGLSSDLTPPADWFWGDDPHPDVPELFYGGSKPVPPRIVWEDGFTPMLDPKTIVAHKGQGAMHTFTREFHHPGDRLHQVSVDAANRFEIDKRRFPPGAYEEHCLLWRQDEWRQPSPDERSQIMGIPPAMTTAVSGSESRRTQVRKSMIGNGLQIQTCCYVSRAACGNLGRLEVFPDLLTGPDITSQMKVCFQTVAVPKRHGMM